MGAVLALLLAAVGLTVHLNLLSAALLYLFLTVSFALHYGFWQASVVSLVAIGCQTYFFVPPVYSFHVADRGNVLSITVFEAIALIVSRVSARERALQVLTAQKAAGLQRLYQTSQKLLLLNLSAAPERQMAELLLREFELEGVAIVQSAHNLLAMAGCWDGMDGPLGLCVHSHPEDPQTCFVDALHRPLLSAYGRTGSLLVRGIIAPADLDALAPLVSLALERHRALLNEGDARSARQAEQLRTTVLDGLAHAFKTPLTVIRAASTGLMETGHLDAPQHRLTRMIDEQSGRLVELTDRLLRTARVSDEHLCLQTETVDMPALVREVIGQFEAEWRERAADMPPGRPQCPPIQLSVSGAPAPISADHDMIASTLRELLENAVKYSRLGSPVTVAVKEGSRDLLVTVQSFGAVVRMEDRERIFEMFYRAQEDAALEQPVAGTGIGLSVARRTTQAHGGHIWVTSSGEAGTTFHLSMPRPGTETGRAAR